MERHPDKNYINAFAIIVNHEMKHREHKLHNFTTHGVYWELPENTDFDQDHVCDHGSETGGWEHAYGCDWHKAYTHAEPGDTDSDLWDPQWIAVQADGNPNQAAQDWAYPGSQWE